MTANHRQHAPRQVYIAMWRQIGIQLSESYYRLVNQNSIIFKWIKRSHYTKHEEPVQHGLAYTWGPGGARPTLLGYMA